MGRGLAKAKKRQLPSPEPGMSPKSLDKKLEAKKKLSKRLKSNLTTYFNNVFFVILVFDNQYTIFLLKRIGFKFIL